MSLKTNYKHISIIEIPNGYECHASSLMGLFLKSRWGKHDWTFMYVYTQAYYDSDYATKMSKCWREIADFLDQLNKEKS